MNGLQLSIKKWALLFLLLFLIVPIVMTRVTVYFYDYFSSPYQDELESTTPWLQSHVLEEVHRWDQPSYQQSLNHSSRKLGIRLELLNSAKQTVFSNLSHTNSYQLHSTSAVQIEEAGTTLEHYPIFENNRLIGTVYVQDQRSFIPRKTSWTHYLITEWGGLFVWLFFFSFILAVSLRFVKQKILYPLKEFQHATALISNQHFSFPVPTTPVKEINELSMAIQTMQVELELSLQKQATMEKERKLFISSIIHDLRTPLFTIRGSLEGIKQGIAQTPEKLNKYIEISYQKASLLNQLIDDLHTYTTTNYIEAPLQKQEILLHPFLSDMIMGFSSMAREKDIELIYSKCDNSIHINGDYLLLSRALENIIGNAIRYTETHGQVTIAVSTADPDFVHIIIMDNGIGISSTELPYIFEPLYRGEKSRNRKTGGSGLGLSIAKQVILRHEGTIFIDSKLEEGTTVTISLPYIYKKPIS
ncbi:sensor histidine kinase [Priestia koreensis]|uniref:sensor histidine kinase n=1 Tax=Priestia koreensis TaxID=284581 RepID=UPI0006A9719B|nr:HAMP domain-containing sensor histidine kinase [Priestia koreensis]